MIVLMAAGLFKSRILIAGACCDTVAVLECVIESKESLKGVCHEIFDLQFFMIRTHLGP